MYRSNLTGTLGFPEHLKRHFRSKGLTTPFGFVRRKVETAIRSLPGNYTWAAIEGRSVALEVVNPSNASCFQVGCHRARTWTALSVGDLC